MKYFIILTPWLFLPSGVYALASGCTEIECPNSVSYTVSATIGSSPSAKCYQKAGAGTVFKIISYNVCPSGSTLQTITLPNTYCGAPITNCSCIETNWTTVQNTSVEQHNYCYQNSTTTLYSLSSESRCKSGYYPTSYMQCLECPAATRENTGTVSGTLDVASYQTVLTSTSAWQQHPATSECYLKPDQSFSDNTGTFEYVSECLYNN